MAQRRNLFLLLLRCTGNFAFVLLALLLGIVPFLLGAAFQIPWRHRLSGIIMFLLGTGFFAGCWFLKLGCFIVFGAGDSPTLSLLLSYVFFVAFFATGSAFIQEWRPRHFGRPIVPATADPAQQSPIRLSEHVLAATLRQHPQVTAAVFDLKGFDPCRDLDAAALVERGGEPFGHYMLFRCPQCGHPVLRDCEKDDLYPDLAQFPKKVSMASWNDSTPCPECDFRFVAMDIWEMCREPVAHQDWLITPSEIQQRGLGWIVRKTKPDE